MFKAEFMAGRYALSFKTMKDSDTVYLVPNDEEKKIGWEKTTIPVYAFMMDGITNDSLSVSQQKICCSIQ